MSIRGPISNKFLFRRIFPRKSISRELRAKLLSARILLTLSRRRYTARHFFFFSSSRKRSKSARHGTFHHLGEESRRAGLITSPSPSPPTGYGFKFSPNYRTVFRVTRGNSPSFLSLPVSLRSSASCLFAPKDTKPLLDHPIKARALYQVFAPFRSVCVCEKKIYIVKSHFPRAKLEDYIE